jgi:sterol desaturase/sphingolipid hydroxylase (fatty acid hydroxylase superfamily)
MGCVYKHIIMCAGENYAPFDWLFGTFVASEADFQQKFGTGKSHSATQVPATDDAPSSSNSQKRKNKKN